MGKGGGVGVGMREGFSLLLAEEKQGPENVLGMAFLSESDKNSVEMHFEVVVFSLFRIHTLTLSLP